MTHTEFLCNFTSLPPPLSSKSLLRCFQGRNTEIVFYFFLSLHLPHPIPSSSDWQTLRIISQQGFFSQFPSCHFHCHCSSFLYFGRFPRVYLPPSLPPFFFPEMLSNKPSKTFHHSENFNGSPVPPECSPNPALSSFAAFIHTMPLNGVPFSYHCLISKSYTIFKIGTDVIWSIKSSLIPFPMYPRWEKFLYTCMILWNFILLFVIIFTHIIIWLSSTFSKP